MNGTTAEAAKKAATLVKICGIKEETTIDGMKGLPVDYIGFVFAKSKRQVTPERAAELISAASRTQMAGEAPPQTVGVFVNPTLEELERALSVAKLDVVQLHGEETPAFARQVADRFGVKVWRALPIVESAGDPVGAVEPEGAGPARLEAYRGIAEAILIDTAGGGTGKTFRWDLIPGYQEAAAANGLKLFVAGGLSPDNVDGLVEQYSPEGVDISSGVETDGVKDNAKIAAFAQKVRSKS
ncbi:phosphoribosylanthranilate isomerase [Cohnella thailandensis]|uniref:N-(5'-phosphoribosyl)anthranilate isomerase n=1 Tax=Cohnella thailandensis TaxID=557557 RepID=A0A841T0H9_9BACL|nr:phosphoribosylanthranilate isomerase [Cohnella thailandensis]MBB6635377.1 phosphoribosylanthranilate isomerase [Cohnella thailandensis]MBP1974757.1 phosphoribosylanthranilate isomerase [Cohnella thailandensis]